MRLQKFEIDKDYKSIYIFLKQHDFSENYIKNLRKVEGFLRVNGETVFINHPLKKGEILEINANPNTKSSIMHCILPIDIVFEDEYYLIINKPSGLATMPTRSHYTSNLAGTICHYMDKKDTNFVLRIVNRLDKDTSGLIIIAKDSVAQKELKDIQKTYHALVFGKIDAPLTIDKPIATILNKDGYNENKRIISNNGQEATTFVTPIKYLEDKDITLISCKLVHGRTHQIRVHLSSIGHALAGDKLYGSNPSFLAKEDLNTSHTLNHTALVCKSISFTHPFTKQVINLEIDYPNDIKELIK